MRFCQNLSPDLIFWARRSPNYPWGQKLSLGGCATIKENLSISSSRHQGCMRIEWTLVPLRRKRLFLKRSPTPNCNKALIWAIWAVFSQACSIKDPQVHKGVPSLSAIASPSHMKGTGRFGSVRFMFGPVPVPLVRFERPAPPWFHQDLVTRFLIRTVLFMQI